MTSKIVVRMTFASGVRNMDSTVTCTSIARQGLWLFLTHATQPSFSFLEADEQASPSFFVLLASTSSWNVCLCIKLERARVVSTQRFGKLLMTLLWAHNEKYYTINVFPWIERKGITVVVCIICVYISVFPTRRFCESLGSYVDSIASMMLRYKWEESKVSLIIKI